MRASFTYDFGLFIRAFGSRFGGWPLNSCFVVGSVMGCLGCIYAGYWFSMLRVGIYNLLIL